MWHGVVAGAALRHSLTTTSDGEWAARPRKSQSRYSLRMCLVSRMGAAAIVPEPCSHCSVGSLLSLNLPRIGIKSGPMPVIPCAGKPLRLVYRSDMETNSLPLISTIHRPHYPPWTTSDGAGSEHMPNLSHPNNLQYPPSFDFTDTSLQSYQVAI